MARSVLDHTLKNISACSATNELRDIIEDAFQVGYRALELHCADSWFIVHLGLVAGEENIKSPENEIKVCYNPCPSRVAHVVLLLRLVVF